MAGYTTAYARTQLDAGIVAGDVIRYSENGSSASTHVVATSIAAWNASSNADPAVRDNTASIDSAACDADSITITHWSVWNSTSVTQKTDWTTFTNGSKALNTGDKISWGAGDADVTMT